MRKASVHELLRAGVGHPVAEVTLSRWAVRFFGWEARKHSNLDSPRRCAPDDHPVARQQAVGGARGPDPDGVETGAGAQDKRGRTIMTS